MMRALSLLVLVGCQSAVSPSSAEEAQGVTSIFQDTTAPELTVDPSMHAAWVQAGAVAFAGTVNDNRSGVSVWVDGQAVDVSPAGIFTVERALRPGAHTFTVTAEDAAGNTASESLTVFAGEAEVLERRLPDAARAEVGAALLAVAADALAADVSAAGAAEIGGAFSPFEGCVAIDGVVDDMSAGEVWAEVEADAAARALRVTVSFEHLSLDISGTADVCGIPQDFTGGYVSASGATAEIVVVPAAEGGRLVAEVDSVTVDPGTVTVELPELADALADAGVSVDQIGVADAFARAFEQPFADRDALGEDIAELVWGGMPAVRLDGQHFIEGGLELERVAVTGQGLSARYAAHHVARTASNSQPAAWLPLAGEAPRPAAADATVDVPIDTINHALATAWWAGAFSQVVEIEGGIAELRPALPPLVQPAGRGLTVQFGEIYVSMSEEDRADRQTARAFAELRMGTSLERGSLAFAVEAVSGEAPSPGVEQALRVAVYEALDAALPAEQEPGWLNNGEQIDGAEPVLSGRQRGWLHTALSLTP